MTVAIIVSPEPNNVNFSLNNRGYAAKMKVNGGDNMLKNKTVVLGVSSSIAAYKSAMIASALKKLGADVQVIMTENATEFITPLTFERLTNNRCITNTFDNNFSYDVEHISIAKKADILFIAPATANIIGKLANGIADDMLSTVALAVKCPIYIAPAMNSAMFENKIVQDNLKRLEDFGFNIITPSEGRLACGDVGIGKMPEPTELIEYIIKELAHEKDMQGKRVLVTAGATRERIDPVRFITNHSTGKMGFALARACVERGAEVTLVHGAVTEPIPPFVNAIAVESAEDMFNAVKANFSDKDYIFKAAAVADFTPESVADEKIKKSGLEKSSISLKSTTDILKYLGEHKSENQYLCGFSMETENMLENSRAKLDKKNLDMIVANNLKTEGAGFGTETNVVTIITKDNCIELPKLSKKEVAHRIIDSIIK